ncbi:MAG: SNF2-related protein [Proteiniphilum sp.]|nr:SNF2-related protein [Proteiniphilum sp.]
MAEHTATQITGSRNSWTAFLTTAARLYKYPYSEQLMIYAQRPDATACAEIGLWNEKMRRWVKRGSKGIALIDASRDKPRLRYVFDISDTQAGRRDSRRPFQWELNPEHEAQVTEALAKAYDIKGDDGLAEQLRHVAAQLADEYYTDNSWDILYTIDGSFLAEYDDFNVGAAFREAATISIAYTLLSRCGLDPDDYFEHEDFLSLFDFNTTATVTALGTAVSEASQQVLRQIEVTIKNYERQKIAERSAEHERIDLQPERGLSDSRPDPDGAGAADRQIRSHEEELSEGTSAGIIQFSASAREAVSPPAGNRPDGEQAARAADERPADEAARAGQGDRADGMGGPHEQSESPSGGTDFGGAGIQLSLFPSEQEQMQQAESVKPSASSISPEDIDRALQGWNDDFESKRRVFAYMEKHARDKDTAVFLKAEYGGELPAFPVTKGDAALDLQWTKVQRRIGQLVAAGQFLTEAELTQQNEPEDEAPAQTEPVKTPYSVGDTVYLENDKPFIIDNISDYNVRLQDTSLYYPIFRAESRENFERLLQANPLNREVTQSAEAEPPAAQPMPGNYRITDDHLGEGGPKTKYGYNVAAIRTLRQIEGEGRLALPAEQEILARYVGWGGIPQTFDKDNGSWAREYAELKSLLSEDEYTLARASTLNAHYTSPTVIKAIYETVERMGFTTGNILEPACGIGNFFGLLPESMRTSKLYGVELDSITGRIAKQLYPNADITVSGFEKTNLPDSFFDLAIGNVPFGQYKAADKKYGKHNFLIHDYFFAKALDQVRPGGVVAFIASKGTLDKQSSEVRRYLAQRAELLGAVRLPNNAFLKNAGTEVTSDILFFQKRDRPIDVEPDWLHLGQTGDGVPVGSYFVEHPEMVLGTMVYDDRMYGNRQETTCIPVPDTDLAEQLKTALSHIEGQITEAEIPDLGEPVDTSIPADPTVKNFSYTHVNGELYYRENSRMVKPELTQTAKERITGLIGLRDCVHTLIDYQLEDYTDVAIQGKQIELNRLYDAFTAKYGLINSRGNSLAFADDSSYYLLCSLEVLDENGELERKADMFTKRTIKQQCAVTSVDTASEALAVSIAEKAKVDMAYMSGLTGFSEEKLAADLEGVIYRDFGNIVPELVPKAFFNINSFGFVPADEYLSGNVREKLRQVQGLAKILPPEQAKALAPNIAALEAAQPKDLDASEIDVRLGSTWIGKDYVQSFMYELLQTPRYQRDKIEIKYFPYTAEWNITSKSTVAYNNVMAYVTYGTDRANAYKIMEDTLNLRDVRIYDTVTDPDGSERRVLNTKDTTLAQQKQQAIKDAFKDWIWKDPDRRQTLVRQYNEQFNSTRPREYDGSHITFSGINPEISLRTHQLNAVAHVLYGGNTLLAHEVGAGKTFAMVAAAMEAKRLGLCQKSLFAVPNHLTEQWASEFLRLYPSANILVATKKDFETRNRKKFCARIATGGYDAVIIGHSQFERIPISQERQERLLQEQIWEITDGIDELKRSHGERFSIKQLEKSKKSLEARLDKLIKTERKDDVVTFEQLGVDRLYVDEAHSFKNLFLYTKMRNVAGLSQTDAQKSSDMFLKCRYIDEQTDGKGIIFATGTPVSNSMTELYTMMRYLQYFTLQRQGLSHFDCWASTFGETTTAIELAPEGTGYRARTRFAKFFNLPELMTLFKEVADIKTSDQLDLPIPKANYHTVVVKPTEHQKDMVAELSERAAVVHGGNVDPSVDNMLKITGDGRKLGLDQRIINPLLPDDPDSKVNACVGNIFNIWRDGQAERLTQLVFCDISTPKAKPTIQMQTVDGVAAMIKNQIFNIYDDIKQKLINRGVPEQEIGFIHDANTETRKKELFAKVRSGQVRVLMGSTSKMGAGTNVQDRLIALHDLDCPWRPGDLEQRGGRIVRQGNQNPEVDIYRYVTEGTFDSYLYQTVENKQKFISQIMTSKSPVRSCEDVDETALSYAEIKALCVGNPAIREKMDLDIEVARLRLLKADHQSQQYRLEDNLLKYFPDNMERNRGYIKGFEEDMALLAANTPKQADAFPAMEIHGTKFVEKNKAGAALLLACKEVKDRDPVEIGSYRGFAMHLSFDSFEREYKLSLKGAMTHNIMLGTDVYGNLTRIDNALADMPGRLKSVQAQLDNLYQQVENARLEVGKPFPQEQELQQKSTRLAELDAELNIDAGRPAAQEETQISAKSERPSVLEILKMAGQGKPVIEKENHKIEMEAR